MNLFRNYSVIIQRKLREKKKDLGSFSIPSVIGEQTFNKALCDHGSNINLMPYPVAKRLNLGEIELITLSLQMTYRSMPSPKGIIEDVLLKVDKFIFHMDFIVLDMEDYEKVPLILGRPFLATS